MKRQDMQKSKVFKCMVEIHKDMVSGNNNVSLSKSLRPYVTDPEYMLLSSAELNAELVTGLDEAIYLLESKAKMIGAIVNALIYPVVVLLVMIGVLQYFKESLIPVAMSMSSPEKWPPISQTMLWMTEYMLPGVIAGTVLMFMFGIFLSKVMPAWANMDARKNFDLYFPPFILFRGINGAMFLIALSSILKTGSSAQEALEFIAKGASPYIKAKVTNIRQNMANGSALGTSMGVGLFDKETNVSIDIFSNDKNFEDRLSFISKAGIENMIAVLKATGQIIFYISLVMVAGTIGTMVLGFINLSSSFS